MNAWLIWLYPVALGYLGWLFWPRCDEWWFTALPRPLQHVVCVLLWGPALAALLVVVFGPVWILIRFFQWSLERAALPGTVLGVVLLTVWMGWIITADETDGKATLRERVLGTVQCLSIILFVFGQLATLFLGGWGAGLAATLLLERVELWPDLEPMVLQLAMLAGSLGLMTGYVWLLHWWQGRRNHSG